MGRVCHEQGINNFCRELGITRNDGTVHLHKLAFHVRAALDPVSPRCLAVLQPLRLTLINLPASHLEHVTGKVGAMSSLAGSSPAPGMSQVPASVLPGPESGAGSPSDALLIRPASCKSLWCSPAAMSAGWQCLRCTLPSAALPDSLSFLPLVGRCVCHDFFIVQDKSDCVGGIACGRSSQGAATRPTSCP